MEFREIDRHPDEPGMRRKLFSERGRWELVVERAPRGFFIDLWWTEWPYAPVVGYCVSAEPGGEEVVLAALVRALESVPESARGWDVELYLPPTDGSRPALDPRSLSALPRFADGAAVARLDG
jgi:hypothetical protein